jgi:hypothetical protein
MLVKKVIGETYSNAGILKKAGCGLILDIAGDEFFLIEPDLVALRSNQMADIVNHSGDQEGLAWFSPIAAPRKVDLTAIIARHIYVVSCGGFSRVLRGEQRHTVIREFHRDKSS